jgi:hypothetical protein
MRRLQSEMQFGLKAENPRGPSASAGFPNRQNVAGEALA